MTHKQIGTLGLIMYSTAGIAGGLTVFGVSFPVWLGASLYVVGVAGMFLMPHLLESS